ncbi:SAM-dependent methyltransferase [Luteipulveratus mongoliensis]|uniref:SAM-dependent methlyltransferase n=1 Tax=Luteipulveratus mongoliensis TaxID=571913 RepID=A0A0K1JPP2_9MICO|nr:class I SAM-dependent methyltransferase [Luteipulveratus mongoliensis]AKU18563.1 SAM-dependent methlyltransferase [Luteipulveratus mongoliensis]
MTSDTQGQTPEDFWEDFYDGQDAVWSGRPNPLLVRGVESLTPGSALELGCGEGADAIWLATSGWAVTGVDVSTRALTRAAKHAAAAGVGDHVEWEQHNLLRSFPEREFNVVSAQFLHSPVEAEGERPRILRRAAHAVKPGGALLIGSHAGFPSWVDTGEHEHGHYNFPTTAQVIEQLALPTDEWRVDLDEELTTDMPGPEGEPGTRTDTILRLRRAG